MDKNDIIDATSAGPDGDSRGQKNSYSQPDKERTIFVGPAIINERCLACQRTRQTTLPGIS